MIPESLSVEEDHRAQKASQHKGNDQGYEMYQRALWSLFDLLPFRLHRVLFNFSLILAKYVWCSVDGRRNVLLPFG